MTDLFHRIAGQPSTPVAGQGEAPAGPGTSPVRAPASTVREALPGMPGRRAGASLAEAGTSTTRRAAQVVQQLAGLVSRYLPGVFAGAPAASTDPMTRLPAEIAAQVLGHLDPGSLASTARVNRSWNAFSGTAIRSARLGSASEFARFAQAGSLSSAAERFSVGGLGRLELGGGSYTRADLEQLPTALLQSLEPLHLGHGATLAADAWALVAELPALESLCLGRGAVPKAADIARLNATPGLKAIEAQLCSPEDFDAIADCTKPLQLRIDGRASGAADDTGIRDEDLRKLPPSTTAATFVKPLPNVTGTGWAALNQLPELHSLRAAARHPIELMALSSSSRLTALDILEQPLFSPDQLDASHFGGLPDSVRELVFHGAQSGLDAAFWSALGARPGLRGVSAVARGADHLTDVSRCDKLKKLELRSDSGRDHARIRSEMIRALPQGLEELRVGHPLPKVDAEAWLSLNDRPALRRLDIAGRKRGELQALAASTKVTGLDFSTLTDYDAADLARLPPTLRTVAVGEPQGQVDAAALAGLREALPQLERFELHAGVRTAGATMQAFGPSGIVTALAVHDIPQDFHLKSSHLAGLPSSLRELSLRSPRRARHVDPAVAKRLRDLPLERLEMDGLPVDEAMAAVLAGHPTLRSLTARRAGMRNAGAAALATAPGLKTLDVSRNLVGDDGVRALLSNSRLKVLDASENVGVGAQMRREQAGGRPLHLDRLSVDD